MLSLLLEPPIETLGVAPVAHPDGPPVPSLPVDGSPVLLEHRVIYRFETIGGEAAYLFCFGPREGDQRRFLGIADHWERPRTMRADPFLIDYLAARYDHPLLPAIVPLDPDEREAALTVFDIAPSTALQRSWIATMEIRERSTPDGVERMVSSYDHRDGEVRYLFLQRLSDGRAAIHPVPNVSDAVGAFMTHAEHSLDEAMDERLRELLAR